MEAKIAFAMDGEGNFLFFHTLGLSNRFYPYKGFIDPAEAILV